MFLSLKEAETDRQIENERRSREKCEGEGRKQVALGDRSAVASC